MGEPRIHTAYRSAWWTVAHAIVLTGADCTVLDPDAPHDETYHDEDADHGVILVRTHCGLGWTVIVTQTESDLLEDE